MEIHKQVGHIILAGMNTSYATIIILLSLSDITCKKMSNITKLLPAYVSNIEKMVCEISKIVAGIENIRFDKASFINIVLPTVDEDTIMPLLMEETAKKLGSKWLVTTNDGRCRDKFRVLDSNKPTVTEYTPDFYIIPL